LDMNMKHTIYAGIFGACLLHMTVPVYVQSGEAATDDTMPYVQMANVVKNYSRTLAPHVRVAPIITADSSPTGEKSKLSLVIHAANGDIPVPVASDGSFVFPITQALILENPPVSLQGADNGGSFAIVAQFKKERSDKIEEIPYSEIMLPYTYGIKMQEQARLGNPNVPPPKMLSAQILVVTTPSAPLVIMSKTGEVTIGPTDDGELTVPYSTELLSENPMVVFPTNAVTMGPFRFEESADSKQSKVTREGSEQSPAGDSLKAAPEE
jgi:hypothetical protein